MNDGFAQLAMMQPQMGPVAPPTVGPVGGRLAQLWEAFKTDPNMRQAVLAASTAMMQSPPPGQNSLGMIGAGIQQGMQTFDSLKERQRAQTVDEQRYGEQMDLKRKGVDLQERGLEEQVKARKADRKFRSLMQMNQQEFQATERDLDRQLQRELAGMAASTGGRQSTHPTVHLAQAFGESMYRADPTKYDAKAAELNAADGANRTGLDMAVKEQVQIQNEAQRFVKENPDYYNQKAFAARLGLEGDLASDPIKLAILQEMFSDNPEQLSQIMQVITSQAPNLAGTAIPPRAPRPPVYSMRLEPGATPAIGERGQSLEARVAKGEGRIYPETGEALFLRGSQQTGFWVENRRGERFEIPENFDSFPPIGR